MADVKTIQRLINEAAVKGTVLPRSISEIYESLRDFFVADEKEVIVGCSALHITWEDLAEIRSLVIPPEKQGQGLGGRLITACCQEAAKMKISTVFVLANRKDLFLQHGFTPVDKNLLPHKIWSDCIKCPKFPDCDEEALWKKLS